MSEAKHAPRPWKPVRSHEGYDGPYFDIEPDEKAAYDARPFIGIEAADGTRLVSAHDLFTFAPGVAELFAAAPELLAELKKARTLLRLLTVRHVIEAGEPFIEASGLNPWCINEGRASGDERLNLWSIDFAIDRAEGRS